MHWFKLMTGDTGLISYRKGINREILEET